MRRRTVCALLVASSLTLTPLSAEAAPDRVWVAVEDGRRLVKIDTSQRRIVRRVSVSGRPHNLVVSSRGVVVATQQSSGSIVIIRRSRVREIFLGASPHDVKIARGLAIVANEGAARLDRVTLKGRIRRPIHLRANPHDLAIALSKKRAWVTLDGTDDIAIVDLEARRVRRYLSTGVAPHDVLFAPDGRAWVTDWNGDIHVFGTGGRRIKTFRRGIEPHHLTFLPNGRRAWVTDNAARRVYIVSVRRLEIVAVRRSRGRPHHIAATADGRKLVVADHDGGRVVLFNAKKRRYVGAIAVGAGPHGVWRIP